MSTASQSSCRQTFTGTAALILAYSRIRLRTLAALIFNPLAIVLLCVTAGGYIWVLVKQGNELQQNPATSLPYIAAFGFGLCLSLVALTAQRGSPLRLQPGDVSWVLQSSEGPRVIMLIHAFGTSVVAFMGSSIASATALTIRGSSPALGFVSGVAVLCILLLIRAVSLLSHLFDRSVSAQVRRIYTGAVSAVAVAWTVAFFAAFLGVYEQGPVAQWVLETLATPFRAILVPESDGLIPCVLVISFSVLGLLFVVGRSQSFIEPGVEESLLANQIAKAISGGRLGNLQGGGFVVGLRSWERWPATPVAAVLCSHMAQLRRRRWQYPGIAIALILVAVISVILQDIVPMPAGFLIGLLILAMSGPTQGIATDLEHQHLLLEDISLARAGFAGISLNALLNFIVATPATLFWIAIYYGSSIWGLMYLLPLGLFCFTVSLAGIAARAFSEALAGRVVTALILTGIPLLSAISSVAIYGDVGDAFRAWATASGTLLAACLLYSGLVWGVFLSARPASRLSSEEKPLSARA